MWEAVPYTAFIRCSVCVCACVCLCVWLCWDQGQLVRWEWSQRERERSWQGGKHGAAFPCGSCHKASWDWIWPLTSVTGHNLSLRVFAVSILKQRSCTHSGQSLASDTNILALKVLIVSVFSVCTLTLLYSRDTSICFLLHFSFGLSVTALQT